MTTTENNTIRFEEGNLYEMRFIGDSELRPSYKCIKRTAKSATFKAEKGGEKITRRIKKYDGSEYVLLGSYSMAPSINAKRIVK